MSSWKKVLESLLQSLETNQISQTRDTRNAVRYNNHDDLVNLSFILKVSVFLGMCLEPHQTSMMKLSAKIAESC